MPTAVTISAGVAPNVADATDTSFLGRGVCTIDGDFRNWGISRSDPPLSNEYFEQDFSLIQIEDFESVCEQMSLSANAGFSAYAGAISISAAVEFAKSRRFEQYSLYVLVKVNVVSKTLSVRARFEPEALATLTSSPTNFLQKYGDRYISDVKFGGEMYAVVQYLARSEEEKQSLITSFSGSFGNTSVESRFAEMLTVLTKHTSLRQDVFMVGVRPTEFPDAHDVVSVALKFPTLIRNGWGSEKSFRFGRYTEVLDFPPSAQTPSFSAAQLKLTAMNRTAQRAQNLLNAFEFAIKFGGYFYPFDRTTVNQAVKSVKEALLKIGDSCNSIIDDPAVSDSVTVVDIDFEKLPAIPERRKTTKIPIAVTVLYFTVEPNYGQGTRMVRGETCRINSKSDIGDLTELQSFSLTPLEELPEAQIELKLSWWTHALREPGRVISDWQSSSNMERWQHLAFLHGFGARVTGPMKEWFTIKYAARDGLGQSWHGKDGEEIGNWQGGPQDLAATRGRTLVYLELELSLK